MKKLDIPVVSFSTIMYRLEDFRLLSDKATSWVSTHPDTDERIKQFAKPTLNCQK